jgi:hypothetical protein
MDTADLLTKIYHDIAANALYLSTLEEVKNMDGPTALQMMARALIDVCHDKNQNLNTTGVLQ